MPNKPVTLYLDHSAPPTVVPVSQGDTDWTYVFTVMNNGEVYSPDVTYVIITGHKPDGNVFAFLGSKSGSRYQLVANGQLVQMTAVPGDVPCELRLMKNGRSIGTTNFILRVEPGPEGVVTVASASALPAYVTILNQLAGIMAQAESIPSDIGGYISDWLEEHISGGQGVAVDNTLTVQGAAADAKATGDRLTALEEASIETDETLTVSGAAADAATVGSALADCGFGDSEVYEYQTNAGYIKTDGTTGSADQTRLEVTSARIAVQPGEKLRFTIAFPSAQQLWLAYGKYSSNGTFTERVVLVANVDYANYSTIITVPEGTYGIVLSYTTYGTASASLEFLSETPVERIRALEARGSLTDTQLDAFLALFDHVVFKDDPNDAIYGLLSAFNATGTIDTTAKIEMTDSFASGRDSYKSWSNAAITITYGTANGELRYNNRFAGILPHALSGIPKSSNNPSMQFLTNGRVTTYYNEISSDLERWMQPAGSSPTEFEANGQISGGYNGVRFSVDVRYLDVSYIYDAETGNVLFAGRNTPYFGMKNINGTMRTRGDTDVF